MLIAEDLLLLLTDDDTGRLIVPGTNADVGLGGALLVELALMGRVDIAGPAERVRSARLVVRDPSTTGDNVLDEALAAAGHQEGKRPQGIVAALGKRMRSRLYTRLAEGGVLHAQRARVFGVLSSRWPTADASPEAAVRAALVIALRHGVAPNARTGALVSLLFALNAVHKAVEPNSLGLSQREMYANARRIAEGDWAARAVRQAIDSMNAAVIAAASSTVILGSGSGS